MPRPVEDSFLLLAAGLQLISVEVRRGASRQSVVCLSVLVAARYYLQSN